MSYYLYRFGSSQLLPVGDSVDGMGGDVPSDAVRTAGSYHMSYGNGVVPLGVHRLSHRGIYSSSVQTNVNGLMGLLGQRQQLWRKDTAGALYSKYARLLECRWDRDVEQSQHALVSCEFEALGYWRAAVNGNVSRASTGTLTPTSNGAARVFDAIIYYTAASTATQTIRFQDATEGVDWQWSGSMTAGHILTIDCGGFSVLNNGANAYSGLTLNAGHASDYWCVVRPGLNTFTFTLSAGAGTFALYWYDQWV